MMVCKRILSLITLFFSTIGLLLSLAGGVGIWIMKQPVTEKATRVFERIEGALDLADQGLDQVNQSLANAADRLESVREEQRKLGAEPQRGNVARRLMARTVQQRIAPELSDAHEKLDKVAQAAVVANSVLEDLGNFPLLSASGLDLDRLGEVNRTLSQVESSAWELSRLFGETEADAGAEMSRIEHALKRMRELIVEFELRVTEVRHRTEELKSRTLGWITPASILISLACFWIALSQGSLMCHAWSCWKHSGRNNSRPC
jgi:chromosome segregation ATPase